MLYQQPQGGPLQLDPSYAATFAYNAGTGNESLGAAIALVGTPLRVTGPQGIGFRFDTSAKYINVTPRGPQTLGPFNFVYSFAQLGSVTNGGTILKMVGTSGNNNKIDIYTLSDGSVVADVYNSTGSASTVSTSAGQIVAGGRYTVGLEFDGSTLLWRINGVRSGTAISFSGTRNAESATLTLGGTTTASASANHDIRFAAFAQDRGPALTSNPWQLFLDPDEEDEALMFGVAAGGASDTLINPGTGTLTLTGYAPTLTQTTTLNLAPGAAALAITSYAPSVVQTANQGVSPDAAALTLTGYAPSVTQGNTTNIAPGAAALTLTGYAPSIAQTANQSILPGAAALTITGFAPVVAQTDNHSVAPGAGVLAITGYAPTITQQTASPNLTPGSASLSITGYAPTIAQVPAVGAPRYARPITDVAAGSWQPSVPGASLASMVDEPSADSSDYIYANSPGSCEIALAPVQNPHSITGQVFRYQMWSPFGNGVTVRLMCGAAVIAEWVHASLPTVPTIFPQTLSAAQCLSITDYNDLRLVAVAG